MIKVKGRVKSGGKYDSKHLNWEKAKEVLGYEPFPGTLNVLMKEKIPQNSIVSNKVLFHYRVYPAKIKDINCHIGITGKRTLSNASGFVIIAPVNLRKNINLKDEDIIEVKIKN